MTVEELTEAFIKGKCHSIDNIGFGGNNLGEKGAESIGKMISIL